MALNLYGVTPATLSAACHDLTIDTQSSPPYSAVEEVIIDAASEVFNECGRQGIDPTALTDSLTDEAERALYRTLRKMVVYYALDEVLTSRDRGNPEVGKWYRDRYAAQLENLRKHPQTFAARESGTDSVDYPARETYADRVTQGYTLPGKLVSGGI